jgi:hypothetical protein
MHTKLNLYSANQQSYHFDDHILIGKVRKTRFNPKSRHENAMERVEYLHDGFIEIFVILQ